MEQRVMSYLESAVQFLRGRGYGHVVAVMQAGELRVTTISATVKPHTGEELDALIVRLRREYGVQDGDAVELIITEGRLEIVRLTYHHNIEATGEG
jgi:ABC-type lipoprotein release transport system permease subunit